MSQAFRDAMEIVEELTATQLTQVFRDPNLIRDLLEGLSAEEQAQLLVAKNAKVFGGINAYIEDFLTKAVPRIVAMPEGAQKEQTKKGQRGLVQAMLAHDGVSESNKTKLQDVLTRDISAAPAAGGKRKWNLPRKMTRRYCKKTPCRKMGFTQKASCRPWKNCY